MQNTLLLKTLRNGVVQLLPYAFWLLLAFTTWLMLIEMPIRKAGWPYWDKVQHMVIFTALSSLAYLAYVTRHKQVLITLVVYGAAIECLQSLFTVTRVGSWGDWTADIIGVLFGFGVYFLLKRILMAEKK